MECGQLPRCRGLGYRSVLKYAWNIELDDSFELGLGIGAGDVSLDVALLNSVEKEGGGTVASTTSSVTFAKPLDERGPRILEMSCKPRIPIGREEPAKNHRAYYFFPGGIT
ncbi:hypothetical protein FOZ62_032326, partial [Perkinsus olseni]